MQNEAFGILGVERYTPRNHWESLVVPLVHTLFISKDSDTKQGSRSGNPESQSLPCFWGGGGERQGMIRNSPISNDGWLSIVTMQLGISVLWLIWRLVSIITFKGSTGPSTNRDASIYLASHSASLPAGINPSPIFLSNSRTHKIAIGGFPHVSQVWKRIREV